MTTDLIMPLAHRSCEGCAMCCKLPGITELEKPEGQWCIHCSTRKSCDAYDTRPQPCRTYYCYYMLSDNLGEEWRPTKSRMIVSPKHGGKVASILVDTDRPDAWRKEPYFSTLQRWSREIQVLVSINRQMYQIHPDRVEDLGLREET